MVVRLKVSTTTNKQTIVIYGRLRKCQMGNNNNKRALQRFHHFNQTIGLQSNQGSFNMEFGTSNHHQINIWEDPTWNLGSSHLALYYPIGIHWDVVRHLKVSKMVSGHPKPPDSESTSVGDTTCSPISRRCQLLLANLLGK
jgi:hypothetical protein